MKTIVEASAVSDVIDQARSTLPRVDEAFDGLKWRLARQPDAGRLIGQSTLRVWRQESVGPGIPTLVVLYEDAAQEVILRRIQVIPP